jgi:hypothetical protein
MATTKKAGTKTGTKKEHTNTGRMGSLNRFNLALATNKAELQDLEPTRAKFDTMVGQTHDTANRQGALRGQKQDLSKQLRSQIVESERLANVLRKAVQAHYGIRAEKLAEFGLQPFRGRVRAVTATPATPETPTTTPSPAPEQPTTQHPTTPAAADAAK